VKPFRIAASEGTIICGIYGAVVIQPGRKWNSGIIRALTWANRERGTDSLGFFDSSGKMTKGAGDPSKVLQKKRVKKWLANSRQTAWFVAGHTRFATRGKVNRRNSHPFRYGRIIGSHNGICDAPQKFQVDSEYLFYAINKARGDYQKGLEAITGYWGLSWYDGEHFYLLSHNGELAYEVIDGVLYYSSSWSHLDSCTGGNSNTLKEGQVLRISSDGTIANSSDEDSPIKPFVSKARAFCTSRYNWTVDSEGYYVATGRSGSGHTRNYASGGRGCFGRKESASWEYEHGVDGYLESGKTSDATVRDYDAEWQEAWADYCTQSEHSLSDEEHAERYAG
jgi:hypothetical protein